MYVVDVCSVSDQYVPDACVEKDAKDATVRSASIDLTVAS